MNEHNIYGEKEINLKELLFALLNYWRFIALWAIFLGIILAGGKLVSELWIKESAVSQNEQEEYEKELETYQVALAGYERDITSLESILEDYQIYVNESVLMRVDPANRPIANAEYLVKLDESEWMNYPQATELDPTDIVVHAYITNLKQRIEWDEIAEKTNVAPVYLKELINISQDYNSNTFAIGVTYEDLNTAEWILDEILMQINEAHDELACLVGDHTINLMGKNSEYVYDSEMSNRQKQNFDKITSYENDLQEKKNAINSLKEPEMPTRASTTNMLKTGIKYSIVGLLAGGFLSVCWFAAVYILNGRVHTEGDLKSQFGLRILGTFALPEKKGFLCSIDRWLERLEGTAERPSEEEVLERCVVNIQNYIEEGSQILFTGTVSEEQLQRLGSRLSEKIAGRNLVISPNMNKTTETLRQLADCQAVILVEQREVSRLNDIREELESIQGLKKPVVGCLVM